jgi:thymidylate kinase
MQCTKPRVFGSSKIPPCVERGGCVDSIGKLLSFVKIQVSPSWHLAVSLTQREERERERERERQRERETERESDRTVSPGVDF